MDPRRHVRGHGHHRGGVRLRALAAALLVAALALPPALAQPGEGFGVSPATIEIRSAIAGEAYASTFTVQNRFESPTLVSIEPFGATGDWTSFSPASPFEVPARSNLVVRLLTSVPADAAAGARSGGFRLVAEAKDAPESVGLALRYAVDVPLDVAVGTDVIPSLRGLSARAEDVELGGTPRVVATVANEGNVRGVARVLATLSDFRSGATIAEARATADVIPGERIDLPVLFDVAPALGQYVVNVALEGEPPFAGPIEIKVFPFGAGGKAGKVRYVQHEPWVDAGQTVKIVAVFENLGHADITSAKFIGEVYLGTRLMGTVESSSLVAPADRWVNFTAYFTPDEAGDYTVVGRVVYDGYETLPASSVLNVAGSLPAATPIAPALLTFLIVAGAGGAAVTLAIMVKRR